MIAPWKWLSVYKARAKEYGSGTPCCNACKRPIYPFTRQSEDILGRVLHNRCYKRANMAPELALMLRACVMRLGGHVMLTRQEIMSSPTLVTSKSLSDIVLTSAIEN